MCVSIFLLSGKQIKSNGDFTLLHVQVSSNYSIPPPSATQDDLHSKRVCRRCANVQAFEAGVLCCLVYLFR